MHNNHKKTPSKSGCVYIVPEHVFFFKVKNNKYIIARFRKFSLSINSMPTKLVIGNIARFRSFRWNFQVKNH